MSVWIEKCVIFTQCLSNRYAAYPGTKFDWKAVGESWGAPAFPTLAIETIGLGLGLVRVRVRDSGCRNNGCRNCGMYPEVIA